MCTALDCVTKDLGEYVLMWRFSRGDSKSVLLYADRIAIEQKKPLFADVISLGPKTTNGLVIKRLNNDLVGEYRWVFVSKAEIFL